MPGAGFYSYVHKDDDAESGRIVDLSQRLVGEYGLLSGESLDLFVDRRSINWGDDWRSDIDSALQNGNYFLPVLTPRYFRSPECRRELTEFSRRAIQLGAESFILPIVWVMFDELTNPDTTDEAIVLVRKFQWSDWSSLRLRKATSRPARTEINQMAERLLAADTATPFDDSADPNGPVRPGPTDTEVALDEIGSEVVRPETQDENTDGLIERIQTSSDQLAEATGFLQEAASDITEIGEITAEINRGFDANAPANYVAQVRILDDLAARIAPAALRLEQRGRAFRSTVDGLADNVRFQLTWLTQHARSTGMEETATVFAANLEVLVANGETAVEGLTKMQHSLAPLQNVSKQLRPRIRNIDNGLTAIIEGTLLMTTWRPYIAALKGTLNNEVAP